MDSVFAYRNPEAAIPGDGRLQGLRIAIQPNISAAGWPSDAGSNALTGFTALEDATIVKRLREAGAYFCGSTRMSEFGFGLRNSGAGGAVCDGSVDAELVMDYMGESRLAASQASVCCLKPSYGLVSRFGLIDLIPSMECCGLLSASLSAIRDVLSTIAGLDDLDYSLPDEKIPDFTLQRIEPHETVMGIISEAEEGLSAAERAAFRAAVDRLRQAGFPVRELSLPEFSLFSLVHSIVGSVEASSCAGRYDSVRYGQRASGAKNWNEMYLLSRGAAFGTMLKSYLFQGAYFQFERYAAYEDACRIRARLVADMQQLTSQAAFLVLPLVDGAAADAPASLAETYARFSSTLFANVTGQPVLYLPPAPDEGGGGIQLAGPRLSDARLLSLGDHLLNMRQGGR